MSTILQREEEEEENRLTSMYVPLRQCMSIFYKSKMNECLSPILALRYRTRYEEFKRTFVTERKTFQHVFQLFVQREEEEHEMC